MKYLILTISLFFLSFQAQTKKHIIKSEKSFLKGETLTYRLHYGLITAGEATLQIQPELKRVNSIPCYDFNIKGKTTGAFSAIMKIEDEWQSYVDTNSLHPLQSSREIVENSYYLKEKVDFTDDQATVTWEKRD